MLNQCGVKVTFCEAIKKGYSASSPLKVKAIVFNSEFGLRYVKSE